MSSSEEMTAAVRGQSFAVAHAVSYQRSDAFKATAATRHSPAQRAVPGPHVATVGPLKNWWNARGSRE